MKRRLLPPNYQAPPQIPERPREPSEPPIRAADWWPIHCWHLGLRDGRGVWEVCRHSAEKNCDLRVVGLSTYKLRDEPTVRYPALGSAAATRLLAYQAVRDELAVDRG